MIDVPARVCLDLAIIIVAAHLTGALFRRIGQPAVAGQIIAGIALGPSLLGLFPGDPTAWLFPVAVLPSLKVLAQLGAVFFMFIVGLEADLSLVRHRRVAVAGVSLTSIVVPFGLGIALASYLYEQYPPHLAGHDLVAFSLFVGAAMSVTAFPVLARILSERNMLNSVLGAFALGCAAVDDVVAWSLLAIVVGVVKASGAGDFVRMILELVVFGIVLWCFTRKVLTRLLALGKGSVDFAFIVLVVGVLLSAWVTDRIGLELIFGAFLFGALIPKAEIETLVAEVVHRMESVTLIILLPVFFVVAGLAVNVRTIGWSGVGVMVLIILAAIAGKFGGASFAARFFGLPTRQSLALGILMNTRGLTELVILTVGLSLGVLVPQLFTLFVIMAVVTTLLTGPAFRRVYPDEILHADIARARRMALAEGAYSPLVVIEEAPGANRAALALGRRLCRGPGRVTAVRFLEKSTSVNSYSGIAGDLIKVTGAVEALEEVSKSGVEPIVQLSEDRCADLIALAERDVFDVALVAKEELMALLAREVKIRCDLIGIDTIAEPSLGSFVILVDGGVEADAAIEAGLRAATKESGQSDPVYLVPGSRTEVARCHRVQHRTTASTGRSVTTRRDWSDEPPEGAETLTLVVGTTRFGIPAGGLADRWPGPVLLVAASNGVERPSLEERLRRLDALALEPNANVADVP